MLLVHLRGHKFGRPDNRFRETSILQRSQTKVTDFDASGCARNKDIITFQITMDDGRGARVKEVKSLQDLATPGFEHLRVDLFEAAEIGLQRPRQHQLRHQDDILLLIARRRR